MTKHLLLLWLSSKSIADYSVVELFRSSFGERQRAKDSVSETRAKFPTASIIKTRIGTESSPRCHATRSVDISWTSNSSSCIYHASRDIKFRARVLHIQPINLIYRQLHRTVSCPCDHSSGIVSSLLQISKYLWTLLCTTSHLATSHCPLYFSIKNN
jgi:hypothetical protein